MVSAGLLAGVLSCSFFSDGAIDDKSDENRITYLTLSKTSLSAKVGDLNYIAYNYSPSTADFNPDFSYDKDYVSVTNRTENGFVITGLKEGQTVITVSAGKKSVTLIATFEGYSENYNSAIDPYIYSKTSILQLTPGDSERIYVSLYNGTVSDNNNYTWNIENPAVAEVAENGQYCVVKALSEGYSRIKVTNTAATYPYYIGVYVLQDYTKTTYITSSDNIKTVYVDSGSQTATVDLVNPKSEFYKQNFSWEILSDSGDTDCISILANNEECKITPVKSGQCTLRVTNTEAAFPLDIIVRSIEIVDSAYIETSSTVVNISDSDTEHSVTASIIGLEEGKDYSDSDFVWEVDDGYYAEYFSFGNQITFKGKHNGTTYAYVSHPKCQRKRQILIVCENQAADAIDASCYITTTQNFIKTKVGAEDTVLNVSLKGGNEGDERNFKWDIVQQADDGKSDVISVTATNNNSVSISRSAQTYSYGSLHITPLAEGTATITVSHPRSYYTTEILVKVLNKDAVLEDPLYFTGSGIIKFLNSDSYTYTVSLNGNTKTTTDEANIEWKSNNDGLNVAGNETQAVLTSTLTGSLTRSITITHPKVNTPKDVLVLTADTQEELDAMKAFYSDKTYYSVNANKNAYIYVNQVGYTDEDGNELDFSTVKGVTWTSSAPEVFTVEAMSGNPLCGIITGLKAGSGTATIKYGDVSATFNITVYPENVDLEEVETSCYFTTSKNVIIISEVGSMATASVTGIGLAAKDYKDIVWKSSDESVATVIGNGTEATITAVKEGTATLTVSHTLAENILKIYVRIGSQYVTETEDEQGKAKYITVNSDTIAILKDASSFKLQAYLMNGTEEDNLIGFSFEIEDESVAKFAAAYSSGEAYVKPVACGQTEITVSHTKSSLQKKVLVVIANTAEELAAFKYLSTSQNVVTILEGSTKQVSVNMTNSSETILDGYTWQPENPAVASVSSSASTTAIIKGNAVGTTKVKVSNTACSYSLDIIVQVLDASAAASCPYIQATSSVLELTVEDTFTTVTATLEGGDDTDTINMEWSSDDPSVIEAYGQNGVGKVRAVAPGVAYLRISHPKAFYDQLVLCICSEKSASEYSISVSSGNILSIQPTSSDQTITASLINGTTTDKYNFKWSLDVYDIVDMTYAANTAIITPKKAGIAQLTVSHPKSAYDQTVVIKVQQFSDFAFGSITKTIPQGNTTYISMEVPSTSVKTTVVYEVDDPTVCSVEGTNAVLAITGLKANATARIHAKLMAGTTVYAETDTDLLVNITAAAEVTKYIASSGQTIYVMDAGTSKTFTADLVGTDHPRTDVYSLQWETGDPSVLELAGAVTNSAGKSVVTGSSCYGKALTSGETTLTVSYPGIDINLVYHIIIPAKTDKEISLDKRSITLEKMKSTEITATIEGGSTTDYKNITWTADKVNGDDIVDISNGANGGKKIQIIALKPGKTFIYAQTAEGKVDSCQVTVSEAKTLNFTYAALRVKPTEALSKKIEFTMLPSDSTLSWYISADDEYFMLSNPVITDSDKGKGYITVTGIKESKSAIPVSFVTSYGKTASLNITVAWDYDFSLRDNSTVSGIPEGSYKVRYTVSPGNAVFTADSLAQFQHSKIVDVHEDTSAETRTGYFLITPLDEYKSESHDIIAVNPAANNAVVGKQGITTKFIYKSVTLEPAFDSSDGVHSKVGSDGNIYMGDGETATFSLKFSEKNTNAYITSVTLGAVGQKNADVTVAQADSSSGWKKIKLYSVAGDSVVANAYRINWATRPEYYSDAKIAYKYYCSLCGAELEGENDECSNPDCREDEKVEYKEDDGDGGWSYYYKTESVWQGSVRTETVSSREKRTKIADWKTAFKWASCTSRLKWTGSGHLHESHDAWTGYIGIISKDYSNPVIENTASRHGGSKEVMGYDGNGWCEEGYRWVEWANCKESNYTNASQVNHQTGFYWERIVDPDETGKVYDKTSFESVAWWYNPNNISITHKKGSMGHGNHTFTWNKGIVTENVSAELVGTDATVKKHTEQTLTVKYIRNGSEATLTIPVYYDERNCTKTYRYCE